jgi:N-acetylglucosaminyldiphosphoundecaprenol N-acetyl-beta-D-mannosaminyltransferase
VLYADGYGICWAYRIISGVRTPRVPGVDLADFLLAEAARRGRSAYLLGAAPEVNRAAVEAVRRRYPGLGVAGSHHGYFEADDESEVVRDIRASGADVLLVAMGSPRQEEWIDAHLTELGVGIAMGVGGTFDVLAGAVRRAPRAVQRLGLEWAWRAVRQPSKVRRVLSTRPQFIGKTLREAVRRRTASGSRRESAGTGEVKSGTSSGEGDEA